MPAPLRILQFGLGPIGLTTALSVIDKSSGGTIALVGAVDSAEDKVGRDIGDLLQLPDSTGVVVKASIEEALAESQPHVVLHTTSSFLPGVMEQLETCIRAGVHVVSSTEELAYPHHRHPELTRRLDALAREHAVVVVGTGVNPGYAMDVLALAATAPCLKVRSVRVNRVVDAGKRREPLQRKVGAGLSAEEFQERKATGTFGHIGLVESLRMLAAGLDWPIDRIEETLEPVVATGRTDTPFLTVDPGRVAGIHHVARGLRGGLTVLELSLEMYVGAPDPGDEVLIEGDPPVHLIARGGIFGDTATAALLINTAGLVGTSHPGLLTMKDLPVPRAFATATGLALTAAA
jgi:2,4-diaminopentanoate dehydrogenase